MDDAMYGLFIMYSKIVGFAQGTRCMRLPTMVPIDSPNDVLATILGTQWEYKMILGFADLTT